MVSTDPSLLRRSQFRKETARDARRTLIRDREGLLHDYDLTEVERRELAYE